MSQSIATMPTLVLLHGWAAHSEFYRPLQAVLNSEIPVLVPDLPGHGVQADWEPVPTIQDMADWLKHYLEENSVDSFIIVGWSMAALVAYDYIDRYADARLKGFVSLDMTVKMLNDDEWDLGLYRTFDARKNESAMPFMRDNWPKYSESIAKVFFAEGREPTEYDAWMHNEVLKNQGVTMAAIWQSISEQDFRPVLPNINVPVLIVAGGKSQLYCLEAAEYLVEHIPNAQLLVCEQSGHAPHIEEPERVAEAIHQCFYPGV
ncbi:MAG: alpha/beta hydrolase [Agarilytica sp.]